MLIRHARHCLRRRRAAARRCRVHAARGQLYVPRDVMQRHGAQARAMCSRGKATTELRAALAELRRRARRHLARREACSMACAARGRCRRCCRSRWCGPRCGRMERRGYEPFARRRAAAVAAAMAAVARGARSAGVSAPRSELFGGDRLRAADPRVEIGQRARAERALLGDGLFGAAQPLAVGLLVVGASAPAAETGRN